MTVIPWQENYLSDIRDASILLLISPIFLSSNPFKIHLLFAYSKHSFTLRVIIETYIQKPYYVTYKAYSIRLLTFSM